MNGAGEGAGLASVETERVHGDVDALTAVGAAGTATADEDVAVIHV